MVINQGDIFWVDSDEPLGSGPGYRRPFVVVQNDAFNHSRIGTVVVCALTSTVRHASRPGNVLLEPGEGGLPRRSVVNVSQILTLDKSECVELIGTLSPRRVRDILDGLIRLLEPEGDEKSQGTSV